MLKNYIKIAWRNLWKNRVFSLVNIAGLAIGLSAFWLITLYIINELSYDRYHKNADRIYRAVSHAKWDGGSFDITGTSAPLAPTLKAEYPEIEETVRIDTEGGGVLHFEEKKFTEGAICFADKSLFNLFTYHFICGDARTALAKSQSIVLSESLAAKLFGDPLKALNKTITFENNYPNVVTGVVKDPPANSHLTFAAFRSFPSDYKEDWGSLHLLTYLRLAEGADVRKLESKLPLFVNKYLTKELVDGGIKGSQFRLELQPLTSIHLHSKLDGEAGPQGNIQSVYIFCIIGLLILLIASINYMNLSTARALIRVKEIGVRKVIGAGKNALIQLFLTEAVLITLIASIFAALLSWVVFPWYVQLTGKQLDIWYFGVVNTLATLGCFSLLAGLLSGMYPAVYLSGFKLIPALKGQTDTRAGSVNFRKALVIFQFLVSILMITASVIVYQQLRYVSKKDLGFNKDQVLTFHLDNHDVRKKISLLKNELLQNPLIESVAAAGIPIGNNYANMSLYTIEINGAREKKSRMAHAISIDEDFISTLQLKLLKGRNYSKHLPTDKTRSIVVNHALVENAGWKDPIGKKLSMGPEPCTVIGVVNDFHFFSLQHKVEPLVLPLSQQVTDGDNLYVRVNKNNIAAAIEAIKQTYQKFDVQSPFTYSFLDQNFAKQYQAEQKQGNILLVFTILAIAIACLGLFGLVTFMIEQRVKEIGIRKVLGASVNSIVQLVSTDFIKLVLISAVIAFPIAWWAMHKWLQDFAYRVEIEWWVFALAGIIAMLVALATISIRAIKAAIENPVKSLRSE